MSKHRVYSPNHGKNSGSDARLQVVERVYRDDRGALPDFSRFDRRSPTWRRWAIGGGLVALAILAVAAWASFLVFKPYAVTSGGNVVVTIDAPTTVIIGGEISYRIRITNDDRIPVASLALELKLPPNFAMISSDPVPDEGRELRWTIGALPARESEEIEIRGRLYGAPKTEARVEALAIYRPANFNADFQVISSAVTTFDPSPLTIGVTGPSDVLPGEQVAYLIEYTNTGSRATSPAKLVLEVPRSFVLTSATPERIRKDELLWNLGEIAPQAKGTITVLGTFGNDARDAMNIRAMVVIEPEVGQRLTQAEATAITKVLAGDVSLVATVNDQSGAITATPGMSLQFRVALRNTGTAELRGITVAANIEATAVNERSIFDFNALVDVANGIVVGQQKTPGMRVGTITWTAKEVPGLAALKPGDQIIIPFSLPIRSGDGVPADARATFTTSAQITSTGTTDKSRSVASGSVVITVRNP